MNVETRNGFDTQLVELINWKIYSCLYNRIDFRRIVKSNKMGFGELNKWNFRICFNPKFSKLGPFHFISFRGIRIWDIDINYRIIKYWITFCYNHSVSYTRGLFLGNFCLKLKQRLTFLWIQGVFQKNFDPFVNEKCYVVQSSVFFFFGRVIR